MRLVAWNCRSGLDPRRGQALAMLGPDLAVVSEISGTPALGVLDGLTSYVPGGRTGSKDFGIAAFGPTTVRAVERQPDLPWALPVQVEGERSFLLVGIWTVEQPGQPRYEDQIRRTIGAYETEIASQDVVLAGDFNCCFEVEPRRAADHAANVDRLKRLGLVSAFHACNGFDDRDDVPGTLLWHGRSFHCDLAFVPERWVRSIGGVTLGSRSDWIDSGLSDHVPLIIDLVS